MSYSKAIDYLYNLQKYGIKFGLNNISALMSVLDNPHESFLSVHVAGTNGKGSTSAIIASILKAAGLKVGLFTSPHIVSFTERIRINGEEITEDEVISLTEEIRDVIDRSQQSNPPILPLEKGGKGGFMPTFFEVVTAMALLYFKRKKIDIAVIEAGMGGRLDATNIITPEVSVITNTSYDHMEFLGSTLAEIAREKAGIIKEGVPVVVSEQESEVKNVLKKKAVENNCEIYFYAKDFSSVLKTEDISGICFDYCGSDSFVIQDLFLPLTGMHQVQNACVAIKAIELLNKKLHSHVLFHTPHLVREGLANVRWPGRLEFIKDDPPVVIDGAHNPAAARCLAPVLEKIFLRKYKKIVLVLGIMSDKDVRGIMEPLLPLASEIILASPAYSRAASPEQLAGVAKSLGFFNVRIAPTVTNAIELAKNLALSHDSPLIVITGSFYTIGEAKEAFGTKGIFTRLRE